MTTAAVKLTVMKRSVKYVGPDWPEPPEVNSGSNRDVQKVFNWLRMDDRYEFWASYLGQFDRIYTREVPTAAVALKDGELVMMLNPDYICWHVFDTMAKRAGVLVHEMMHPLFGHLHSAGPPPGTAGNVAGDLSINSTMDSGMRCDFHLHPRHFEVDGQPLEPRRGWRYYYERIYEAIEVDGLVLPAGMLKLLYGSEVIDGLGIPGGLPGAHGMKGRGTDPGDVVYMLTKQKLDAAARDVDKSKIPEIVKHLMNIKYAPVEVIWDVAFKNACRGYTRSRKIRTMARMGKRTKQPPGPQKQGEPSILWAVDTSGSMADHEIDKGYAVLDDVRKRDGVKVMTVQFDARIQGECVELSKFTKMPSEVRGRGGTDFNAVFDLARKMKPSVLVVFTDGYAPFPKRPPFPVIWVYTPNHNRAPYGKHIVINNKKDDEEGGEW